MRRDISSDGAYQATGCTTGRIDLGRMMRFDYLDMPAFGEDSHGLLYELQQKRYADGEIGHESDWCPTGMSAQCINGQCACGSDDQGLARESGNQGSGAFRAAYINDYIARRNGADTPYNASQVFSELIDD
jgi:hypothetical protein